MSRSPRNTANDDPLLHLAGAMGAQQRTGKASDMILEQESQGQQELVNSEVLPTKIQTDDGQKILEEAGVKFLGVVEGDEVFQRVELPEGWEKKATEHSMWSDLVDKKGRVRASIFYKAAFYDRSSHMSLSRRFSTRKDYDRQEKDGVAVSNVMDGDSVVFTTEPIQLPDDEKQHYDIGRQADAMAQAWLDENHPDWRSAGAYWE